MKKPRLRGVRILHEDLDVIVVEKAAGILSQTLRHSEDPSVESELTDYLRKGQLKSTKRAYLVHRLDRETSGIMMVAKTEAAQQWLREHWNEVTEKTYLARVEGALPTDAGVFESYLREDENYFVKSVKNTQYGKYARTEWKKAASLPVDLKDRPAQDGARAEPLQKDRPAQDGACAEPPPKDRPAQDGACAEPPPKDQPAQDGARAEPPPKDRPAQDAPARAPGIRLEQVDPSGRPGTGSGRPGTGAGRPEPGRETTLVEVALKSGRKNQIRVHFSENGHPVVGDAKYGHGKRGDTLCLHAWKLAFKHPHTGKRMAFEAGLPAFATEAPAAGAPPRQKNAGAQPKRMDARAPEAGAQPNRKGPRGGTHGRDGAPRGPRPGGDRGPHGPRSGRDRRPGGPRNGGR